MLTLKYAGNYSKVFTAVFQICFRSFSRQNKLLTLKQFVGQIHRGALVKLVVFLKAYVRTPVAGNTSSWLFMRNHSATDLHESISNQWPSPAFKIMNYKNAIVTSCTLSQFV